VYIVQHVETTSEETWQNGKNCWYSGTDERDEDAEEEHAHGVLES